MATTPVQSVDRALDLLEALGVAIDLPVETCARILDEIGIGRTIELARVAKD